MIPPTYMPALRYGIAAAALVLALVSVIFAVSGIGADEPSHHATDNGTEVQVDQHPAHSGFHEQDEALP